MTSTYDRLMLGLTLACGLALLASWLVGAI